MLHDWHIVSLNIQFLPAAWLKLPCVFQGAWKQHGGQREISEGRTITRLGLLSLTREV